MGDTPLRLPSSRGGASSPRPSRAPARSGEGEAARPPPTGLSLLVKGPGESGRALVGPGAPRVVVGRPRERLRPGEEEAEAAGSEFLCTLEEDASLSNG